jgi:hypothetical protein
VATALPTDIDATFPDDGAAARKQHQQHHDAIHSYTNSHDGAPDPHPGYVLHTEADAGFLAKADNLAALTDKAAARENLGANAAYAPRLYRGARVGLAAAQSIPAATLTAIGFTAETWDAGGWHDNATNNTRLTVPAGLTGYLSVVGSLHMEGTSGTFREIRLAKNGATFRTTLLAPASFGRFPIASEINVAPGDFIQMIVKHDAATALDAQVDTLLDVHFIGASS